MKYLALVLFVLLFIGCVSNERNEWASQIDELEAEIDSLNAVVDSLITNKADAELAFWEFSSKGIENPKKFVEQALRNKPGLIPLDPVLGGTMRFTQIVVLDNGWVVARYEDGHIMGKSLFRYELQQDTTLIFRRLFSTSAK